MAFDYLITDRAQNSCELCQNRNDLSVYPVPPKTGESEEEIAVICSTCLSYINEEEHSENNHWRCLNESIWSAIPAVQVLSYRILKKVGSGWASDILNMAYLDEESIAWADNMEKKIIHMDANGNTLLAGDTVTLIKDLNVKGGGFTAKRGTAVRKIRLVSDNPEHIEGKVEGQQIVILTQYVKKS